MRNVYVWKTSVGPFYIAKSSDGRFHPIYEDKELGSYLTAQQAVEDLAGGHTVSLGGGIDTARLGIPEDVSEWGRA